MVLSPQLAAGATAARTDCAGKPVCDVCNCRTDSDSGLTITCARVAKLPCPGQWQAITRTSTINAFRVEGSVWSDESAAAIPRGLFDGLVAKKAQIEPGGPVTIEPGTFSGIQLGLPGAREAYFSLGSSHSTIVTIEADAFSGLTVVAGAELRMIFVGNRFLKVFKPGAVRGLPILKELRIQENHALISFLPGVFLGLSVDDLFQLK